MEYLFAFKRIRLSLLCLSLTSTLALSKAGAQDYWAKVPALTSLCYSQNDEFQKNVEQLKSKIKEDLEKSKKVVEEKAAKMTNDERMAMATKYQTMTPNEIVEMQNEMMEMTEAQAAFQQISAEFETRFIHLESDFRAEFAKKLGSIEHEYNQLPDGEGTPPWAIKKGEELMISYNKEYESICGKYFTSSNAAFRNWLKEFSAFLLQHEIPFTQKMLKMEYGRLGLTPDSSVASLMAVEKYLDKCTSICNLRRAYPQG
jgi:hypothetical protein